jgi:hypothetical protein
MFSKHHVHDQLYDFLSGTIPEVERDAIEKHLASCPSCSAERKRIEEAFKVLDAHKPEMPALPAGYWDGYWRGVEVRLRTSQPRRTGIEKLLEVVRGGEAEGLLSPRFAYGLLGFALGVVVTLGILSPYITTKKSQTEVSQPATAQAEAQQATTESSTLSTVTQEISQPLLRFFQKAKAFLIAVKNTDESKETATDLVSEQETSQELAAECRDLKRLPLDPREQRLLSELDVVLVQLSKVKNERDSLKLDLVKEGIERNNLVMRIRVHELAREVRVLQAAQTESNKGDSF